MYKKWVTDELSAFSLFFPLFLTALLAEFFPGSNPACTGIFSGSSHTSDSKIGTPVATVPGAWRFRVSTGTGQRSVSILWLGEVESLICNFYLNVAARKIVWADPSLRYTSMLLGRWATNQQRNLSHCLSSNPVPSPFSFSIFLFHLFPFMM